MSGFTRPAPWLRRLFTPSQRFDEPGILSDDVSLVQPYDGGGYALDQNTIKIISLISNVGAAQNTPLVVPGANQVVRVVCVGVFLMAGASPTLTNLQLVAGSLRSVSSPGIAVIPPNRIFVDNRAPILVPGISMDGSHIGGDASTQLRWEVYLLRVPIGTVFYL